MLRTPRALAQAAPLARKRLLGSKASSAPAQARKGRPVLVAATAVVTAGGLWYATHRVIHNDAVADATRDPTALKPSVPVSGVSPKDGSLETIAWGSNKYHLLSSDEHLSEAVRTPAVADWLQNVALRDLALQERHAACIDASGDVYQWGDGDFGSSNSSSSSGKPTLTLRGKNIVSLKATPDRVFALSASGRIYVLATSQAKQGLATGQPTPSSTPWWGTGWFWGEEENVDFAEVTPHEKLSWNERFVSISAGKDHLLALTNSGRTFAHPINLKANAYGQLGLRKVDVPDHAATLAHPHQERVQIELTPKSVADPYAKATPAIRRVTEGKADEKPAVDDSSIHFSDRLFEIPALKGIKVDQIATGSRSSFAKTQGKVLGWGANEFGQIGLGSSVALDAITVPTEVALWKMTPRSMQSRCLDISAGGDLTYFMVERTDGNAMPFVDVLACGNEQYGGLGNAQYSNAQGNPSRVKNASGLSEYDERTKNMQAIYPYALSVSPDGHVLLTMDTLSRTGPGGAGRDLLVWGTNQDYQLGNGKRGSGATPWVVQTPSGQRVILGKRKADVRDLQGRVWKRGVNVEQCAIAGVGNSVVYWRICQ